MTAVSLKDYLVKPLSILVCLAILILLSLGLLRNYLQKQRINKEVSALQSEISELEKGNRELSSLIGYLQTANFLEAEARNKFGLAKEGESVLVITPPASIVTENKIQKNQIASNNLDLWWKYFWRNN